MHWNFFYHGDCSRSFLIWMFHVVICWWYCFKEFRCHVNFMDIANCVFKIMILKECWWRRNSLSRASSKMTSLSDEQSNMKSWMFISSNSESLNQLRWEDAYFVFYSHVYLNFILNDSLFNELTTISPLPRDSLIISDWISITWKYSFSISTILLIYY